MVDRSARSTTFAKARPRILVVDDDAAIRRMLKVALGNLGCMVTSVESSTAARKLIESDTPFALVITDLRLGGASGADLVADVRATLGSAAPPFILFTGGAPSAIPEGVVEVVEKPASIESIRDVVKRALAHRRRSATMARAPSAPSKNDDPTARTLPPAQTPSSSSAKRTKPGVRLPRRFGDAQDEIVVASARDRRRES